MTNTKNIDAQFGKYAEEINFLRTELKSLWDYYEYQAMDLTANLEEKLFGKRIGFRVYDMYLQGKLEQITDDCGVLKFIIETEDGTFEIDPDQIEYIGKPKK